MEQQTPARPPGRPQVLEGRVAIVTGSSRGLGKAIATGLAEAGATVVVSSRKPEQCDITAEEIRRTTGATVLSRACHMGSWDEIPGLVGDVVAAFGGIDVVVNNAGMMPALVEAVDIDLGYWRKIFSVNLEGPLRLSQLVAPIMRERGGGTIVNISSVAAYYGGMRGNSAYPAAKAGLLSLTRSMAREWAPWKIRVNAVSPGPFRSPMNDAAERSNPGFYQRSAAETMLGRVGDTEEIVGPVLYLASDASSFVTGEDHMVTGGILR